MQEFAMPVLITVRAPNGEEAMRTMAAAMMKAQEVPGVTYRRPLNGFNEVIPDETDQPASDQGTDQAEEEPP